MTDPALTAAVAVADQQFRLAAGSFARMVADARRLLAEHDETHVWALLSARMVAQLDLQEKRPHYAADMLAAAAIQAARHEPVDQDAPANAGAAAEPSGALLAALGDVADAARALADAHLLTAAGPDAIEAATREHAEAVARARRLGASDAQLAEWDR